MIENMMNEEKEKLHVSGWHFIEGKSYEIFDKHIISLNLYELLMMCDLHDGWMNLHQQDDAISQIGSMLDCYFIAKQLNMKSNPQIESHYDLKWLWSSTCIKHSVAQVAFVETSNGSRYAWLSMITKPFFKDIISEKWINESFSGLDHIGGLFIDLNRYSRIDELFKQYKSK